MFKKSAIKYYLSSIPTLLRKFNWWHFLFVPFEETTLIKIKNKERLKFYVSNLMDVWTLKEVIVDRQYETFKTAAKADHVIDIGAGIGDFSIQLAKKGCKVTAYECSRKRVSLMQKNLKLNKVINVELRSQRVKSLGEVLKNVDTCNFLKIDCEGGEYEIFNNAQRKDLKKIKYIAMEVHKLDKEMERKYSKLINKLKKNNFKLKIVPNPVHEYIRYVFAESAL